MSEVSEFFKAPSLKVRLAVVLLETHLLAYWAVTAKADISYGEKCIPCISLVGSCGCSSFYWKHSRNLEWQRNGMGSLHTLRLESKMRASLIKYSVLKKVMTEIHNQRSYEELLSSSIIFSEACVM